MYSVFETRLQLKSIQPWVLAAGPLRFTLFD